MTDTLVTVHGIVRTLIIVAALVSLYAIVAARKAGGWTPLLGISTQIYAGLLGLQAILGIWIWVAQDRWTGDEVFLSWIHPIAMIVAIGVAHGFLGRARREADPQRKNRLALVAVAGSLVILVFAIPWFAS
jgi:heme A synthase